MAHPTAPPWRSRRGTTRCRIAAPELRGAAPHLIRGRHALAGQRLQHPVDKPPLRPDALPVDVANHVAVAGELAPLDVVERLHESLLRGDDRLVTGFELELLV